MIEKLVTYVQGNAEKWIESPMNEIFGPRGRCKFKVSIKSKDVVKFEFDSGTILPINTSVFELAIEFLDTNKDYVMIGAATKGLGHHGSLEYQLKTQTGNSTKRAPHISDLLVLADIAEFGYAISPKGTEVHGVKLKSPLQGLKNNMELS